MNKSTLITADGVRITVQPMPQSRSIMIWTHDKTSGKMQQMTVPLDMVGAFTASCEATAEVADREKNGPGTERDCFVTMTVKGAGLPLVPGPGVVL